MCTIFALIRVNHVRSHAAQVLSGWGHQSEAVPVPLELLKDEDTGVRSVVSDIVGALGKNDSTVRLVAVKLFPTKRDAERLAEFLIAAANGGSTHRTENINQLLAKGLKMNGRDSVQRTELRQILFRWS